MTPNEIFAVCTALASLCTSIGGFALGLWGSKKDRTAAEATATSISYEHANQVRKDLEASMQRQTERLEKELGETRAEARQERDRFETERREWQSERSQMVTSMHEFEKRALAAEGSASARMHEFELRALTAENKAALAEQRVAGMELRLADLQTPRAA